jgi:hypothetical protein
MLVWDRLCLHGTGAAHHVCPSVCDPCAGGHLGHARRGCTAAEAEEGAVAGGLEWRRMFCHRAESALSEYCKLACGNALINWLQV